MAVRPNSFSRLRCCAGVSSSSKTTVSASRLRLSSAISSALPRPTKVAGSGASRRCTTRPTTSAPALSTSCASSSRFSSTTSSVSPGEDDPDQDDPLPERALDERPGQHAAQEQHSRMDVDVGHLAHRTGQVAWSPPRRPRASPRGSRPGCAPGRSRRCSTAPQLRAAAAAATLPVPQASVSPTPRSHTRKSRSSPSASWITVTHSTLIPPAKAAWSLGPSSAMSTPAVSGPSSTRCGLPTSTVLARRSSNS